MISEKSFINNNKNNQEMEKRTKEEAQDELIEKFGLRKTSDFQVALRQGNLELAKNWLNYIVENRVNFPQYETTWDSWLADRENDILIYQEIKNSGKQENLEIRSKEEAQQELIKKFGMRKTSDFQEALKRGEFDLAEEWLNYIIENKMQFPQYLASWDSWLADRRREIIEAK